MYQHKCLPGSFCKKNPVTDAPLWEVCICNVTTWKLISFFFCFFCPAWWTSFSFHPSSYVSAVKFSKREKCIFVSLYVRLLTSSRHPLVWDEKCIEKNDSEKGSKTQGDVHKGRQRHLFFKKNPQQYINSAGKIPLVQAQSDCAWIL